MRTAARLALHGLVLALALGPTACRQGPSPTPAPGTPASPSPVPTDARAALFHRVDLLIAQWDAGQAEGRTDQMDAVFARIRQEVDGNYADFVRAAQGGDGVRLQTLGTIALGFSARPEATAVLVEHVRGIDARLAGNALLALKMRADPDTPLAPILQRIPDSAPEPKRYAPLALADVLEARQRAGRPRDAAAERQAVHLLSGVVADRDPYVRLHVAKALGFLPQPGSFEMLQILMRDEHVRIRVAAAAGLERLGDPRGFLDVLRLLADAPDETKPVVRDVLASYAAKLQGRPLSEADVKAFGTSPAAWHRWYSEYAQRAGVAAPPPPR